MKAAIVSAVPLALVAAALAGVSTPAAAQDADVRRHSYDVLIRRIDHFVDRDRRAAIVARLTADRARILALPDDAAYLAAINRVLAETSSDRHLQVVRENGQAAPTEAPSGDFGIAAASVRSDGIGVLRLTGFSQHAGSRAAIDAAAGRLRNARAIILDVRANGGGGEVSLLRLLGHLFAERTELNGIAWRTCVPRQGLRPDACEQGPVRIERRFTDSPPTPLLAGKPVAVLTSSATFSAAEALAYELQERRRAIIVGEPSGGGGSPSAAMDLESTFAVIMPIGRLHRLTAGHGWEGTGIRPDLPCAAAVAEACAVTRLRSRIK